MNRAIMLVLGCALLCASAFPVFADCSVDDPDATSNVYALAVRVDGNHVYFDAAAYVIDDDDSVWSLSLTDEVDQNGGYLHGDTVPGSYTGEYTSYADRNYTDTLESVGPGTFKNSASMTAYDDEDGNFCEVTGSDYEPSW